MRRIKRLKFRHQRLTKRYHPSGFSLIETMLVAMFIAVMAGSTVPQLRESVSLYRLTASAHLVATELNAGRTLAISRNWLYETDLNTSNHTIQIVDPDDSNNDPRTVHSLESDITFSSVPSPAIRFYSHGHARGGTIVLQNENGDITSVVVSASGKVEVQ
jgi:Tfp pilus assembly protein FimT